MFRLLTSHHQAPYYTLQIYKFPKTEVFYLIFMRWRNPSNFSAYNNKAITRGLQILYAFA